MFEWIRRLRRELLPTLPETAEDVFCVRGQDTSSVLAGARDLGSFFHAERLGFTEDTWPYVVIGSFYWDSNPEGHRKFSWLSWRRRMVINFRRPWICVQGRLFTRRGRPLMPSVLVPTDFMASQCYGIEATPGLHVRAGTGWGNSLDVHIDTNEFLLQIIAARLNHLWGNGRAAGRTALPEWGRTSFAEGGKPTECVWRNPDREVLEDLHTLDRIVRDRIQASPNVERGRS